MFQEIWIGDSTLVQEILEGLFSIAIFKDLLKEITPLTSLAQRSCIFQVVLRVLLLDLVIKQLLVFSSQEVKLIWTKFEQNSLRDLWSPQKIKLFLSFQWTQFATKKNFPSHEREVVEEIPLSSPWIPCTWLNLDQTPQTTNSKLRMENHLPGQDFILFKGNRTRDF